MKKIASFIVVLTAVVLLASCATMTPGQQSGALIGGALGAGIPLILEKSSKVVGGGALIGAAVGAVAGGLLAPPTQGAVTSTPGNSGGYYTPMPITRSEAIEQQAYEQEAQRILQQRQAEEEKAARLRGQTRARERYGK